MFICLNKEISTRNINVLRQSNRDTSKKNVLSRTIIILYNIIFFRCIAIGARKRACYYFGYLYINFSKVFQF